MDPTTIPELYQMVFAAAIVLYGGLAFIVTHLLRRVFPIENNAARITLVAVSVAIGLIGAAQVGIPRFGAAAPEENALLILLLIGGAWWVAQEIYRRLRADLWPTKATPFPKQD